MEQIKIREVKETDLDRLIEIEHLCFPQAEAATAAALKERLQVHPECFLVAEKDGKTVGFVNGCGTNLLTIQDELFEDAHLHDPAGEVWTVFGLSVAPDYRKQGIAAELLSAYLEKGAALGKKKVILTCKDHLVHYYEKFGFVDQGISQSTHGGAVWHDMTAVVSQHKDIRKQAENYYLGKPGFTRLNCAQAVLKAFQEKYDIEEERIQGFKLYGGGRAEGGLCGAYYAAKVLLEEHAPDQIADLEESFHQQAGALRCKEIKSGTKFPCVDCVKACVGFIEEKCASEK